MDKLPEELLLDILSRSSMPSRFQDFRSINLKGTVIWFKKSRPKVVSNSLRSSSCSSRLQVATSTFFHNLIWKLFSKPMPPTVSNHSQVVIKPFKVAFVDLISNMRVVESVCTYQP